MSTAFDRLNDPSNFDDKGMVIPRTDTSTDGDQTATPPAKAEDTAAASQTSPDATAAAPAATPNPEDQSGQGQTASVTADGGNTQTQATDTTGAKQDDEETEETLKAKYSKPEDKGNEWQIRLYRDAMKLNKRNQPWQTHLDTIKSTERVNRGLAFTAAFAEPDTDIAQAVQKLTDLSSARTADLRDFLYSDQLDRFPDNVARDLLEDENVTVAEIKEALAAKRNGASAGQEKQPQSTAAATTAEVPKPEGMTDDEWDDFKTDYPKAYEAMQKAHGTAQSGTGTAAAAEAPKDPKVAELETKVKGFEDKEQQERVRQAQDKLLTEGAKISQEAETVVSERLRELGLEPDTAKDDDRTTKLKEKTAKAIQGIVWDEFDGPDGPGGWTDFSKCSPEQAENRKLQVKIIDLLAKDDVNAARDYIELLKGRVELTLERVAPQIEGEVEIFNAAMLQPATRNAQGEKRPEIRTGTAATDAGSKTPWLDPGFKKPGESSFQAMQRYMETATTMPGRQ